ncbi:single-stranded DNA-binding protein [Mucilaginibacter sp. AW1-7]|jgi:single-strand DNA-binding protein|uniref:single-stranded DNA-binding protein n=1 Tax=unclassified Mucilaginibacter TaxID=2617802 RepID=UPI0008B5B19F|nr:MULTISPECIES: single-stranded DNA-binding protein [unclassified Mucilaginibacter]WDF75806.1 single-stranded DNA-binding protein [Mucilaginibacter sp. KACC 22773]SEO69859.1 single-strand binding protein [Mucilaginibacter sp. OK283]
MNTLRNSVRLVGNLGMDPEVKTFDSDKKMVRLSLATNESYKNDKGEKITDTTWHNLVFWNATAKRAEDLLKKGDEVAIEGKLANRNYVDKDGIKRYVSEIVVNDFLKVGAKG